MPSVAAGADAPAEAVPAVLPGPVGPLEAAGVHALATSTAAPSSARSLLGIARDAMSNTLLRKCRLVLGRARAGHQVIATALPRPCRCRLTAIGAGPGHRRRRRRA